MVSVCALLRSRSCNLYRIAENFQSRAQNESSYRRIKRFFTGYTYCYEQVGRLILHWLNLTDYTLCMDRTNWEFGSKHINYLVVSIAWQGNSIPIAWHCLDKQGDNSNTDERIAVMKKILVLIPATKIDMLLADREFVGQKWFRWLGQQGICCRLRIKSNTQVLANCGKTITASQLFSNLKLNHSETWYCKRKVSDVSLYIAARRTTNGLWIIVATEKPDTIIEDYHKRWAIETMFGCLKSRGFNIEETLMTEPERMDKLMGILALAFTWCLIAGHWYCGDVKCLPLNKHYWPARALFREGLDLLRRVLLNDEAKGEAISFLVLLKFCPVHR